MQNPSALYRFETDADLRAPRPGVLVVALGAFIDAGHIQSVLGGHLLEARVRPTLELTLVESPAHLRRKHDPESGLALIRL